ncbi:type I-F CRISPR-associated helicase Cas3f [Acinetobacter tianfuensis]|uniref:Type I-F CRISPR-associated helicase Cas3 n=1 Tax=Acinetobacter tianfuensis TaxID=2419603 RepID=A0A3A8EQD8_9GAMM|nr:type I-F CRISPR-associated helicase Cas3f [Acinetobacter tianfuensis]RKG30623.1 type I-F CRISPR-associated helicase Cas3 [Acinetobacter tianfuensis]
MYTILISACEKKALKKTRAILDSYAIRTGQSSWQVPMTMEGLKEIRMALKRTATRQTAVAAYVNYGMRRMKLVWVVGSKHKFNLTGAYPVASTQKQQKQLQIPEWIKAASLLAGAAGDVHDIGKASKHFQRKLSPKMAGQKVKDQIRHEWLSLKLLQAMRANDWQWQQAWEKIDRKIDHLSLGHREDVKKTFLQNELEAVDYLVVTHHGLLGDKHYASSLHVRDPLPSAEQITCAGDLPESIFKSHRHRMDRLAKQTEFAKDNTLYWKALSLHARAALIHADHIVSAEQFSESLPENIHLFANTKYKKNLQGKIEKTQDQPLDWHLQQVGDRSAYIAAKMLTDLNLSGLSEQTVEYICQASTENRFLWQNHVANALQKQINKTPDVPCLMLNIAGTGSGKTRMNLRAACTLRPHDPRIAIALNLRSLTLQTGEALQQSMNLSEDEIAVIIGDKTTQSLFNQRNAQDAGVDDDENLAEPIFDAYGETQDLPSWLIPLFTQNFKGKKSIDKTAQTVLTSPILVSTIDYLIAAGEPHRQGHHVKALLRLMSSDLVLDEIDGYEPKSLMAVLRLVQLSAMYGRHVICSSATLSSTVADSVYRAFESGIEMRAALYQTPQKFMLAIADNELKPKIQIVNTEEKFNFIQHYQQHLNALQQVLAEKSAQPYRLAALAQIDNPSVKNWQAVILEQVKNLHQQHRWAVKKSDKHISFGLIRVANIKHAIHLAKYLTEELAHAKVACYHANDWLISRFYKEQRLDALLTRHKKGTKRPTGNEHIYTDDEIVTILKESQSPDIPFIVIATPVEEVGRDHDFDWAVIDASSVQSIVQTAGRVNRHRLNAVKQPNIVIPQFNYRYCQNKENNRKAFAFTRPGYEGYADAEERYKTQDLAKLLPWSEENTLVIDARLRFDMQYCAFAKFDDEQIQEFNEEYFASSGDQKFSNVQVHSDLMQEQIYKDTCLRAYQKKEVYSFDYQDDELMIFHYPENQKELNFQTGQYEQQCKTVYFDRELAPDNAWLNLAPEQLTVLCSEQGIAVQDGCKISLAIYDDEIPQWVYHLGFGILAKS